MKKDRHEEILKIIAEEPIATQEELLRRLTERGFTVGQATVSRDIKRLNLIKQAAPDGGQMYAALLHADADMPEKLMPVFKNSFVSCDFAGNLLVIRTHSGLAGALASAVDSMQLRGVLGSIAGDDTVLLVCKTEGLASELSMRFARLAE